MTIHNLEIASAFNELADLLEIEGENPFRIRAYRNAARTINGLSQNVSELIKQEVPLTDLPGIGKDLADKIKTLVRSGKLPLLKEIQARVPPILSTLLKIEGLGPKRVKLIYQKFKIRSLSDLKKVIEEGKLRKLSGFGEKTEKKILDGLKHIQEYNKRIKLYDALPLVNSLIDYLKKVKGLERVECAGSFRRRKETLGDLDILAIAKNSDQIIKHFISYEEVAEIISQGDTRSTVRLRSGIQVDLRVVPHECYAPALFYFTGSKSHNIAIRKIAQGLQLKINEYGIFKGKKRLPITTEREIYKTVGLAYIEPELREDRGEIKLAKNHHLPDLIQLKDIRGDLHCHTLATDGNASLDEIIKKSLSLGYEYLAITDHTQHLTVAHGQDPKRLLTQIKTIDKINDKLKNLHILKSAEIDILEDGTLDLPEVVLKELDFTVCSIHSLFKLSEKKQTERVIRAMDNLYFNILAHPTGRLINMREPYPIDLQKIMSAAQERGCILELNAQPERMDLDDVHCKIAKEIKLKIAISTDAHSISQMDYMPFGVYQARRGWLEADEVINTYSLSALKKIFKRS